MASVAGNPTEGSKGPASRVIQSLRSLARDPRFRIPRRILVLGLVVRAILIPITSWGADTPSFVLSDISFLFRGSPYAAGLLFDPPLAAYSGLPFFFLAGLLQTPQELVTKVPAILPAAAYGLASALIPDPLALVALKIPLLISDVIAALALYKIVRQLGWSDSKSHLALAVWFLNPVVIWASAVHGEGDTLVASTLLLAVLCFQRAQVFASGAFVALATFAKVYPALLLPLILLLIAFERGRTWKDRARRILLCAGGFCVGALVFLPFWVNFYQLVVLQAAPSQFGGVTILMIFNSGVYPTAPGLYAIFTTRLGNVVGLTLVAISVFGFLMGLVAAVLLARRGAPMGAGSEAWSGGIGAAILLVLLAGIISNPSPQSEEVVGILPFAILVANSARGWGWAWVLGFSAGAFGLYMALLTPAAYFYPLGVYVDPSLIGWINSVTIWYSTTGLALRGALWLFTGAFGGACLLAVWARSFMRLNQLFFRSGGESGAGKVPSVG